MAGGGIGRSVCDRGRVDRVDALHARRRRASGPAWSDAFVRRGRDAGIHVVHVDLRYAMIMSIASEVIFFVAWFWAYFDAALFPAAIYPIDVTSPNGTVEATKEVIGMVTRDQVFGGHWPPKPGEVAETGGYFHGTFDPWGLP